MSKFNEIEPLSDEDLAYYIAVSEVGGPAGSGRNTIGYKMAVELRHLRALGKSAVLVEREKAFREALDCMTDVQARDHLAARLQDKYGAWWLAAPKEQGHE